MKCFQCGGEMTSARENYKYGDGLDVTLLNVEVRRCPKCGEFEVGIPMIEELHRAIAMKIIHQRARLAPSQIRWLRKWLGWSGERFAEHVGVMATTVSKWENGKEPMGPQTDRLLRMMVSHGRPVEEYPLDELVEVAQDDVAPLGRLEMRPIATGWEANATGDAHP